MRQQGKILKYSGKLNTADPAVDENSCQSIGYYLQFQVFPYISRNIIGYHG